MCRLYGFRANEPTKVECTLVYAQNALMVQSREDLAGHGHAHGWGVATYEDRRPHVERHAWAACHGEHFRRSAARIFSRQVLAHVRRATVGTPKIENTHPFVDGPWTFIHNGTVPASTGCARDCLRYCRRSDARRSTETPTANTSSTICVTCRRARRTVPCWMCCAMGSARSWNGAARSSRRQGSASTSF